MEQRGSKGPCILAPAARILYSLPAAYMVYAHTYPLQLEAPRDAGSWILLARMGISLLVMIPGLLGRPYAALILAVALTAPFVIAYSYLDTLSIVLGLLGTSALYTLAIRCKTIDEPFQAEKECRGNCTLKWVGADTGIILLAAVLAVLPFIVARETLQALTRLADTLPPDTAPAWTALATSPLPKAIIYLLVLAISAWFYQAIASWARTAALTTREEANQIIEKYWRAQLQETLEAKTWYHRLYTWIVTFTLLSITDTALLLVAVMIGLSIASTAILGLLATIIAFILARRAAKALAQGNPKPTARYLTILTIITTLAVLVGLGPDYLITLVTAALTGGSPPPSPYDDLLSIPETISRLVELVLRIITI